MTIAAALIGACLQTLDSSAQRAAIYRPVIQLLLEDEVDMSEDLGIDEVFDDVLEELDSCEE